MTETVETVGLRIRRIAAAQRFGGATARTLAAALGIHYETLRKWTVGMTAPKRSDAERISRLLEITPEELMYGGADPQASTAELHLAPDGAELALAFSGLPAQTAEDVSKRAKLFALLLGLIELHHYGSSSSPAPPPAVQPNATHRRSSEIQP